MRALPSTDVAAQTAVVGVLRIGVGVVAILGPGAMIRGLGVDAGTAARVTWLTRMAGIRDAALGIGTVVTAGSPGVVPWLAVTAAADAGDTVVIATAARRRQLSPARGTAAAAVAAAGAALDLVLLAQVVRAARDTS